MTSQTTTSGPPSADSDTAAVTGNDATNAVTSDGGPTGGGTTDRADSPSRGGLILTAAISVLLVLALVALVVSVLAIRRQEARDSLRTAVLQAGRQTALDFTTYQYGSWDADVKRVLADSTGQFKEEFTAASGQVKAEVVANQATSKGEVIEAALESMDGDSAQVLVVADAVVTNTAAKTGTQRHYRIKLDLVREGDRWLAADLQAVG